jgi:hypothetical protein
MNDLDWIGQAHNKGLDDFRAQLRLANYPRNRMCSFIPTFLEEPSRVPESRRASVDRRGGTAGIGVAYNERVCSAKQRKRGKPNISSVAWTSAMQSPAATGSLTAIENAIDAATSPEDLASRLIPILEASASQPELERTVIATTVSVTQSSYEYWSANLEAMVEELRTPYEPCSSTAPSPQDAVGDCFGGGVDDVDFHGTSPKLLRIASSAGTPPCPPLGESMRAIGKADARGAFGGAFSGAFFGGFPGAIAGGLIGGAGSSIWAGLEKVGELLYCGYAK